MRHRFAAGLMTVLVAFGLLVAGGPAAHAGSSGRKNTALALGALAIQQLLTKKTTTGLIAGAGAVYAYKRYQDARSDEKRRERYHAYRRR